MLKDVDYVPEAEREKEFLACEEERTLPISHAVSLVTAFSVDAKQGKEARTECRVGQQKES